METYLGSYNDYKKILETENFIMEKCVDVKEFITKNESNELFCIENNQPNIKIVLPPAYNFIVLKNYGFALKLVDNQGKEVSGDTNIEILKKTFQNTMIKIPNILYYNVRYGASVMYHPLDGIELNMNDKLIFKINNYDVKKLDIKKCELYAKMDIFRKIIQKKEIIITKNKSFVTRLMDNC